VKHNPQVTVENPMPWCTVFKTISHLVSLSITPGILKLNWKLVDFLQVFRLCITLSA